MQLPPREMTVSGSSPKGVLPLCCHILFSCSLFLLQTVCFVVFYHLYSAAWFIITWATWFVTVESSIPPFVLLEVFLLNGLLGLTAGYWYRRQGLIAATGIHFWADIIWHVFWPLLF